MANKNLNRNALLVNKFCITLSVLILHSSLFGKPITGIVLKKNTSEGLPFVSIGIKNTSKGTTTDLEGNFIIDVNEADTLIFSSIGYKTLVLATIRLDNKVFLEENVILLNEIVINRSRNLKTATKGNFKSKTVLFASGSNQYAKLIKNDLETEGIIEELIFHLDPGIKKETHVNSAIKIRVYSNSNGLPGDDLLRENIIVQLHKNTHRVSVDVSEYKIPLPLDGAFIGFDFIGYYEDDKFIPYSRLKRPVNLYVEFVKAENSDTYTKYFGLPWIKSMYKGTEQDLSITAKFGVKVSY
jgi:hypothetical protein